VAQLNIRLAFGPARRLRFQLKTLFIAITGLCVGLGLIVGPAERRRTAVSAATAAGAGVTFEAPSGQPGPLAALARQVLPRPYIDRVLAVNFFGTRATDADLASLVALDQLEDLVLNGTSITDAGVRYLPRFLRLRRLLLGSTRVTDASLSDVAALANLEVLELSQTEITDKGIFALGDLRKLKYLGLADTSISNEGLCSLMELKKLQELRLSRSRVTDAGLECVGRLHALNVLVLNGTDVSDDGLAHLSGLNRLQSLCLSGTNVTDKGLLEWNVPTTVIHIDVTNTEVTVEAAASLKRIIPELVIECGRRP
jgi:hypothetical protein